MCYHVSDEEESDPPGMLKDVTFEADSDSDQVLQALRHAFHIQDDALILKVCFMTCTYFNAYKLSMYIAFSSFNYPCYQESHKSLGGARGDI